MRIWLIAALAAPLPWLWSSVPADATDCTALPEAKSAKLVMIPAGSYRPFFKTDPTAGQPVVAEKPVAAFWMDAAPVTRGEFLRFLCDNPDWRKSNVKALFAEPRYLSDWTSDLDAGSASLDQPVTHVSWFAARAYCAARNARLPTIAQWERVGGSGDAVEAARRDVRATNQGAAFRFAMGRAAADLRASGLVFGGVWEWTADFNSVAAGSASLFCGDGMRANDARDYAAFLRYSFRSSLRGNYTLKNLGFRCIEELPQ